ncbi:MAG: helix-turn-helix transcriptional regulator [Pseudomonadota bacterium]
MEIQAVVGRNVKRCRELKGLSQEELKGLSQEELAFQSDLHRTYVSGVERGIRNPTVAIVARLAVALDVKPAKLLEFQED